MGALTLGLAKRDRGSLRLGLAKKRHGSPETMSKRKRSLLQINTYHLTPSQRRVHVMGKDIATTTCYNNSCQRNVAGPYNGQKKNAKSFRVHFLATSSCNSNRKYSNKANTTTAKSLQPPSAAGMPSTTALTTMSASKTSGKTQSSNSSYSSKYYLNNGNKRKSNINKTTNGSAAAAATTGILAAIATTSAARTATTVASAASIAISTIQDTWHHQLHGISLLDADCQFPLSNHRHCPND